MIRRLRHQRATRGEQGAVLVLALLMITTVAVVTGAVLTRGDGSLRAAVALRDVARTSYAADAAANVAINDLRTGYATGNGQGTGPWYFTNAVGTGCFGYDGTAGASTAKTTLTLDNIIPKRSGETQQPMSAAVVCTPEDATGEQGSAVAVNNANKPGNAILTLGTGGEDGFVYRANGSGGAFRVRGGIWVNSNIVQLQNGDLSSTESIRAVSGCDPANAMVAPVVNCSASAAADPAYPNDLTVSGLGVPALQTPPASCPNNSTIQLQPGYYDDVSLLNALTTSNTTCTINMLPGTYYLDFHNDSGTTAGARNDPLYDSDISSSAANEWMIGPRKTLIAGTLTSDTTVPGRCVSPIDDAAAQGVQLIFGGDSRMSVVSNGQPANVEICGSYSGARPPIAIYGQPTGTAMASEPKGATAIEAAGPYSVTAPGAAGTFSTPTQAALKDAGNGSVLWQRDNSGSNSEVREVDLGGFSPPMAAPAPAGTVLVDGALKIRHRSTSGTSNSVKNVTLTSGATTATLTGCTLAASTDVTVERTVDLKTCTGWGALQKVAHDKGIGSFRVVLSSTLTKNQAAEYDSVRLELKYYRPQLRAQTTASITGNVVSTVGSAGSPVVLADGNATNFYIQGTSYVPTGKITLNLNNIAESVFRFGVIARSLRVIETGSFEYPGAVIELPDNSPGFGFDTTIVQLKVYLCPGVTSGCTPSGTPALQARVLLKDQGASPSSANRKISILSWSHPR